MSHGSTRRAAAADVDALVALMDAFYAESAYPLDHRGAAASFRALLDTPGAGAAWVAEVDGHPAGHVVLAVRHAMEFGGPLAIVDDLYVRPDHRRRSLAAALLQALFDDCATRGCRAVQVEVAPDNAPARAVYARFGLIPPDPPRLGLSRELP